MKLGGRRCDACSRLLLAPADGRGCGACDVALCHACLDGTDRCPSCQRSFAVTVGAPPMIRGAERAELRAHRDQKLPVPVVAATGAMILAAIYGLLAFGSRANTETPATPRALSAVQLMLRAREGERFDAFRRRDEAMVHPSITSEACPVHPTPPPPLPGRAVVAPFAGDERFAATYESYFLLRGRPEVLPLDRAGVGPIREPRRATTDEGAHRLTLIVEGWRDPAVDGVIPPSGSARFTVGRLVGRVVLYDLEQARVICAAEVAVESGPLQVVRGGPLGDDDPRNRARLDLIVRAVREGVGALRAAGPPRAAPLLLRTIEDPAAAASAPDGVIVISPALDPESLVPRVLPGFASAAPSPSPGGAIAPAPTSSVARYGSALEPIWERELPPLAAVVAAGADRRGALRLAVRVRGPGSFAGAALEEGWALLAFTPDGSPAWARAVEIAGPGAITNLAVDAEGQLAIAGLLGADPFVCEGRAVRGAGYVATLDAEGRCVWARGLADAPPITALEFGAGGLLAGGALPSAASIDGRRVEGGGGWLAAWTERGRPRWAVATEGAVRDVAADAEGLWAVEVEVMGDADTARLPSLARTDGPFRHVVARWSASGERGAAVSFDGDPGLAVALARAPDGEVWVAGSYRGAVRSGGLALRAPATGLYLARVGAEGALRSLGDAGRTSQRDPARWVRLLEGPQLVASVSGHVAYAGRAHDTREGRGLLARPPP